MVSRRRRNKPRRSTRLSQEHGRRRGSQQQQDDEGLEPERIKILEKVAAPQTSCPLFTVLPAEIRHRIFSYALADYPDPTPDHQYEADSLFSRPSYFAPRRNEIDLLLTCCAIYHEAWFLPFVLREQTYWLTNDDRAPPEFDKRSLRDWWLKFLRNRDREDVVESDSVRVFAQMFMLERHELSYLFHGLPDLQPRRLTLTIRHTDWWFWEDDEPLRFEADWLYYLLRVLPSCVREVHVELETIKRKTAQLESIATDMTNKWFFQRSDGVCLFPDVTGKSNGRSAWRGTSTLQDYRWERDETEPGKIDYRIIDVVFRTENAVERRRGAVSDWAKIMATKPEEDRWEMNLSADKQETDSVNSSLEKLWADVSS